MSVSREPSSGGDQVVGTDPKSVKEDSRQDKE